MPYAIRRFVDRLGGKPHAIEHEILDTPAPTPSFGGPRVPAAGPDAGLVIDRLTVRYGGVLAVEDVTVRAPIGVITGLIGPNGAGKTTAFNACSGLLKPTAGRIVLHGTDVTRADPSHRARRGLGRTFQRVQLFESLDVRTNVALARECGIAGRNPLRQVFSSRGDARTIQAAVNEAIELVGIEPLVDAPVKDLSTGQRRLVELARVLAGSFDLLLLDEPSSGLDQSETEEFGAILQRVVAERGVGILLVEHDMALVQQICERVHVLDFGRLLFEGSADEMVASEVVRAAYLGSEGVETALDTIAP